MCTPFTYSLQGGAACEVPASVSGPIAFVDFSVIYASSNETRSAQTVVVERGQIRRVGPFESTPIPDGATVVEGCGRYLAPGLADMHVHLLRADVQAYVDNGITTVRHMWGYPDAQRMADEIASRQLVGPTVYAVSSGLDDLPEHWPYTQLAQTPTDAERLINEQVALGYTTLKVYQDLRREVYDAIVEIADAKGVDFVGHVPTDVGLDHVLDSRQRSIEHLSGSEVKLHPTGARGAFAWREINVDGIPAVAEQISRSSTWSCPTLSIFTDIGSNDPVIRSRRQLMVKALFDAGALLLVGTDAGTGRLIPGASIHDEMAEFVEAGLSPAQVFTIATEKAASFLDASDDFGRVATGTRADLLVLDANPLIDLATLEHPVAVFARGERADK